MKAHAGLSIDETYFFLGAAFFAFTLVLGLVLLPHPHPAIHAHLFKNL